MYASGWAMPFSKNVFLGRKHSEKLLTVLTSKKHCLTFWAAGLKLKVERKTDWFQIPKIIIGTTLTEL